MLWPPVLILGACYHPIPAQIPKPWITPIGGISAPTSSSKYLPAISVEITCVNQAAIDAAINDRNMIGQMLSMLLSFC